MILNSIFPVFGPIADKPFRASNPQVGLAAESPPSPNPYSGLRVFPLVDQTPTPYDCGYLDGPSHFARFCNPVDLASDGSSLYVADAYNHVIRKIVIVTGLVTTVAGSGGNFGNIDEQGVNARFRTPQGITADLKSRSLYVTDTGNHTIRSISLTTGEVKTIAGSSGKFGFADGRGPSSRFNDPEGIIADPSGNFLYVADTSNHTIRKIDMASHSVTTLAGQPGFLGYVDGSGKTARFDHPAGVAINRSGTFLYITDSSNQAIRKVSTASGEVTTIAGPAGRSERLFEKPVEIALGFPRGITLYQNDSLLFFSDTANHAIRQIELATRKISTWNIPQAPHLALPQGILYDGKNNFLFISNKATNSILKMAFPSGMLTTLAGPDFQPPSSKK